MTLGNIVYSSAEPNRAAGYERALILVVALVLRVSLGLVFYGSTDLSNGITASAELFKGRPMPPVPYYPILNAIVWLQGVLSVHTPLPVAFCQKLVPIIFDSLIALLIYDSLARRRPSAAFPAAMLCATSPVTLIVTCFHGQWEAICMFFLALSLNLVSGDSQGRATRLTAGACFTLSFLVKPFTTICFPLLFAPLTSAKGRDRWLQAFASNRNRCNRHARNCIHRFLSLWC